ncbi:MAG: K+-dependent Na+/Ca+ exchanger family protein [Candidatus Woesebacteria bacterium GW2011_GWB1_45_5]|uniref:K+-dependent Na+/Ca+ exchanger family protein n=1 Tax=Candidatus Woesebacteria bacterium GW2011_GWB1_45_5 TaxID=1618581 RepID=A0A0G1MP78_9BACT|nr:MAG: K+-dependent Na+/Ca+ exchanger family protein [Candidatus Woesebacteria bacterium GW2011_GWB1_45_5]
MIILYVFLFFALAFILTKAADLTLESIKSISRVTGTKAFVLSALILSVATSLPELFVGITSALEGSSSLSLGNILGANITNILLVAGLSTVVAGGVVVHGEKIFHEFILAAFAGVLPLILLLDGTLGRVDGLILLVVYLAYTLSFFKKRFVEIGEHHLSGRMFFKFIKNAEEVEKKTDKSVGHLLVGIAALLFLSDLIVRVSTNIASSLSIPVFIVGLLLLSVGTTLPEMIVSFKSLKSHSDGIFFGNLLGSVIINSTLILGLVSVINPISVDVPRDYFLPGAVFVIASVVFCLFIRTKHFLSRHEAVILLLLYLIFIILEFL